MVRVKIGVKMIDMVGESRRARVWVKLELELVLGYYGKKQRQGWS